jgi:hypothetical protein
MQANPFTPTVTAMSQGRDFRCIRCDCQMGRNRELILQNFKLYNFFKLYRYFCNLPFSSIVRFGGFKYVNVERYSC